MLSVFMLSVVMLNVIILSVAAPKLKSFWLILSILSAAVSQIEKTSLSYINKLKIYNTEKVNKYKNGNI